ncbi:MAG: hypothetical protein M3P39_03575, partial [Actinomycetota bacterium]|nr:hypothetical protein [Actinomycetota bacterium]
MHRRDADLGLAAVTSTAGGLAGVALLAARRAPALPRAFGDGAAYEAMARGEPGAPPFHRRVLMPALVRRLGGGEGPAAFRPVALGGLLAGSALCGMGTFRVARRAGAPAP